MLNAANDRATCSISCIQQYKSALVWHMDQFNMKLSDSANSRINKIIGGYKTMVAEKKSRGIMPQKEGKSHLSILQYNDICTIFAKMMPDGPRRGHFEGVFAWVFTTLMWNTVGRSINVAELRCCHFNWENDSLLVTFSQTKGDRSGESTCDPKHIFANPTNPAVCPITSLCVYLMLHKTENKIFAGNNEARRYGQILATTLRTIGFQVSGSPEDIGTHSNRKGAATYCNSFPCGPTPLQIYLRAGWSIGKVQDRYLFNGSGGDCLVGRTLAGLCPTSEEFALLTPHFHESDLNYISDELGWENIFPGYSSYTQGLKSAAPYLFASFVYNFPYLNNLLGSNHVLYSSNTVMATKANIIRTLRNRVHYCTGQCSGCRMVASGVPPQHATTLEMVKMKEQVRKLEETVVRLEATIAQHVVRLEGTIAQQISGIRQSIPESLHLMLSENYEITGVRPASVRDVSSIAQEIFGQIQTLMRTNGGNGLASSTSISSVVQQMPSEEEYEDSSNVEHANVQNANESNPMPVYRSWRNGTIHPFPQDFEYRPSNTKSTWRLWFLGDVNRQLPPFVILRNHLDCLKTKVERNNVSRTFNVVSKMLELIEVREDEVTSANVEELYERAFPLLLNYVYAKVPPRAETRSINTLANLLAEKQRASAT